jgi:GT2 family glycosyltransferase
MMVRAEVIADVGLMDEDFFMYCEEIDWCWRMQDAGWKTLCVPTAHVIHHAGRSSEQVRIPAFVNLWKSRARLYARHHGLLTRRLAKAIVLAGMRGRQRKASPEMSDACREVVQFWKETV